MTINYRNGVSIGELAVYIPALAVAIYITACHGFRRNAGWVYLILFTLVRIVGSSFQLATITKPHDTTLYIGSSILQNIGLSPLELTALGLLSRVIDSIRQNQPAFIHPTYIRVLQIVILVGLILGIVGGVNASDQLSSTGVYTPQTLSKVAVGLYIASFVGLMIVTILTYLQITYAEPGEMRLLHAVALSLPFILVRLVYLAIATLANPKSFNTVNGDVTTLLFMALLMELVVVIIFEAVGLSIKRVSHDDRTPTFAMRSVTTAPVPSKGREGNFATSLGRRTIIGRLITSIFQPS